MLLLLWTIFICQFRIPDFRHHVAKLSFPPLCYEAFYTPFQSWIFCIYDNISLQSIIVFLFFVLHHAPLHAIDPECFKSIECLVLDKASWNHLENNFKLLQTRSWTAHIWEYWAPANCLIQLQSLIWVTKSISKARQTEVAGKSLTLYSRDYKGVKWHPIKWIFQSLWDQPPVQRTYANEANGLSLSTPDQGCCPAGWSVNSVSLLSAQTSRATWQLSQCRYY